MLCLGTIRWRIPFCRILNICSASPRATALRECLTMEVLLLGTDHHIEMLLLEVVIVLEISIALDIVLIRLRDTLIAIVVVAVAIWRVL